MKVLVCGSRNWTDKQRVFDALDKLMPGITCVVSGGCRGADAAAMDWAEEKKIDLRVYPADWASHGLSAGPRRNQQMLSVERPDIVLAFGPSGPGTTNMLTLAERYGFRVEVHQ